MSQENVRAIQMRNLRLESWTTTEIGELYGVTGARVTQILKELGGSAIPPGRRKPRDKDTSAKIETFLVEYGEAIRTLAYSGATRADSVERLLLLVPGLDPRVIGEGIDRAGVSFNIEVEDFVTFSLAVVESAVWYALARDLGLQDDRPTALNEIDLILARDVSKTLGQQLGFEAHSVASILSLSALAQAHAQDNLNLTFTSKRYDIIRREVIKELGHETGKGLKPWPPTSQTVMKRLGGGLWAEALKALGLTPGRGRARGGLFFQEDDYNSAVTDFLKHAVAAHQSTSPGSYRRWVGAEQRAGRHRPSIESIHRSFGSWTNAKRAVTTSMQQPSRRKRILQTQTLFSAMALHDAQAALKQFIVDLDEALPTKTTSLIKEFVQSYIQEFEYRRRGWLRAVVAADASTVPRLLESQALKSKQRVMLEKTPPELDGVLTDRYIDGIGVDDPRQTEGWLRSDAQADLEFIPDEIALQYKVLREARNYLTHDSKESHRRLREAIQKLGEADPRFNLNQSLTRTVLIGWFRASGAKRLRLLCSCIPALWRAMLAAETVLKIES